MISNKHIETFQSLYKKHFGIEINREEAEEKCSSLVRLVELVYFPEKIKEYEINRKKI